MSLVMMSCGREEEGAASGADSVDVKTVKKVSTDFLEHIFDRNFEGAEKFCTKASYSSLKKLHKAQDEFLSIYLKGIDSCSVDSTSRKTAICFCELSYFNEESFIKPISLEKFGDEWLVQFELDKTFDNVFLYDYSFALQNSIKDVDQEKFDSTEVVGIKKRLSELNSSYTKLGFSQYSTVQKIDSLLDGSDSYAYSDFNVGRFVMSSSYDFGNELLSYYMEVDNLGHSADMTAYYQDFVRIMVEVFGEPFNVSELADAELHEYMELRWFVKGYNEVLTLTNYDNYFFLELEIIP